jgi:hypothetical protein
LGKKRKTKKTGRGRPVNKIMKRAEADNGYIHISQKKWYDLELCGESMDCINYFVRASPSGRTISKG